MKEKGLIVDRTIEILQHNIDYWYEKDQEMPEYEQEHIRIMIAKGYSAGELNDNENSGWWNINRT